MVTQYTRFWLVCNPERINFQPPNFRHDTYESAVTEAQRLARAHPGCAFHVLGSMEFFEKQDLRHHTFEDNTELPDTAVPF